MRRIAVAFASFALAVTFAGAAHAQTSFSIGPRVSSYSTDLDAGINTIKTGRQSAYGVAGDFQNGKFVLDYLYDHDPQNGISVVDLLIDTGDYTRDRGEVTVGYAALPGLDLQVGARTESFRVGGIAIVGNPIFTDMHVDNQAIVFGARIHTPSDQRLGFYALARGYVGSAKVTTNSLSRFEDDSSGYRLEGGISIPLGESSWAITPGVEYEHIETNDLGLRLNTNRFILAFVYRSGRH